MSMTTIRNLENTNIGTLYQAWEAAFREYERTWTRAEFDQMLLRRGYVPALSFGAFDGEKLVSFTLNSIDHFNGVLTAYDTGTGTLKKYRGGGLASRIFNESRPHLVKAGVDQYILEVLQYNTKAVSVYQQIGFRVRREFNYFVELTDKIRPNHKILPKNLELRETDLQHKDLMMDMWDFPVSWQNSFESIYRSLSDFKIIGAFDGDTLAGYGITDPSSGDITQLAVARSYRKQGIGSAIFKELLSLNKHKAAKVINTEIPNTIVTAFVENNGIPKAGSQFEMVLVLR